MARIDQHRALADFMDRLQDLCVEEGITIMGTIQVEVASGLDGVEAARATVWRTRDTHVAADPDYWHIEGAFI